MTPVLAPHRALSRMVESTVDDRSLALTRVVFAVASLLKLLMVAPFLASLEEQTLPLPVVPLLPDVPWTLVCSLWALAAALLLFGVAVPLTAGLLATCAWYTLLLDERSYSNHLLLLALLATFLAFTHGGKLRGSRRRVHSVGAVLVLTQVSTMYAFAAIAKINPSFLSGEVFRHDIGPEAALLSFSIDTVPQPLVTAGAVAAIATELGLAMSLWVRRLRPYAFAGGVLLHLSFVLTMHIPLGIAIFGLLSVSSYPLFASWRAAPAASTVRTEDTPLTERS